MDFACNHVLIMPCDLWCDWKCEVNKQKMGKFSSFLKTANAARSIQALSQFWGKFGSKDKRAKAKNVEQSSHLHDYKQNAERSVSLFRQLIITAAKCTQLRHGGNFLAKFSISLNWKASNHQIFTQHLRSTIWYLLFGFVSDDAKCQLMLEEG